MSGTIIEPVTDISVFATEPKNYRSMSGKGCPKGQFSKRMILYHLSPLFLRLGQGHPMVT